ncbi:hypothetical protein E4U60_000946 [Claviceps pazoutovae]|uniref:Uncharacterized protein n=1 Tax=Claviceps pazoutovae TaxID=1649127 RepID=A0A9P7MD12_9HYPO|nr:hypothetical protein E4U60_000946 [Claviceps pazoutovae]
MQYEGLDALRIGRVLALAHDTHFIRLLRKDARTGLISMQYAVLKCVKLPELSLDVLLHRSCGMGSNNNNDNNNNNKKKKKRLLNENSGAFWNTKTGYQTSSLAGQFFKSI